MNARSDMRVPAAFLLNGRIALLTGAGGHLGVGMASALCEAGARVILNGRREGPLTSLAVALKAAGYAAEIECADVSRPAGASSLLRRIRRRHGRLDILVNNAYNGRTGSIESATADDFRRSHQIGLVAPFLLLQGALDLLEKAGRANSGGSSVVNVASMYGIVSPDPSVYSETGMNNPPFYGAAKAALIQLTRHAACHLAPRRIRVNCISPGPFPSASVAQTHPGFIQALRKKVPLSRIGRPDELKGPLLFLASDASSYVTGTNLVVDGGWTAW